MSETRMAQRCWRRGIQEAWLSSLHLRATDLILGGGRERLHGRPARGPAPEVLYDARQLRLLAHHLPQLR